MCALVAGNAVVALAAEDAVTFSRPRGFYVDAFELELELERPDATVLYSLDGSTPSPTTGRKYDGPIPIATTTVVRACAVGESGVPSRIYTCSYIFCEQVAAQPPRPAGYPTSFFSLRKSTTLEFDYAMDAEVYRDGASGDLASHLQDLPSLSIALRPLDFKTLYENHSMRGRAWERAASVELIYPPRGRFQKFAGFQVDCGLRMQGGLAVDQARKKSFRLLFKKQYGTGKLRYPLFESAVHHAHSASRRLDTVVLRAGGNGNWSKDDARKHAPGAYIRDQLVRDTMISMTGLGPRGIFTHVYVNGLYSGLYNLTERPDAKFLAAYFGGEEEDHFSVNHSGVVAGDPARWLEFLGRISTFPNLRSARSLRGDLDVAGFCDYVLLNWAVGMGDWPYNNWYAGIVGGPTTRIVFLPWDSELAFWSVRYHNSNPGAWVNPLFASNHSEVPRIWRALQGDADFRMLFADRVYTHCREGGPLADEEMRQRFRRLADTIEGAIVAESARWGDAATGNEDRPRTRERDWRPNCETIDGLIAGNAARFIAALRAGGYYPSIDPPSVDSPVHGLPGGYSIRMRNPNPEGTIVYTVDGSDPRTTESGVRSPRARDYDPNEPPVIDETTRLRARILLNGEWSALADEIYLVDRKTPPLLISEIHYHPEDEGCEFIEIHNASSATIELTGMYLRGVRCWFPPWGRLEGHGTAVLVPHEDVDIFRDIYPGVPIFGTYGGTLSNQGEKLSLNNAEGTPIFAVEYADRDGWPRQADGPGHSLELSGRNDDPSLPECWSASELRGGSPGRVAE